MPAHKKLSDPELRAYVERKIVSSMNREDGDLSDVRENLFSQYYGAKYGNEREGRSSFVTREVMEAVEWAAPGLIRMFFGSGQVVSFDPVGPEDEAAAQQETDVVNHKVERANGSQGFLALHNFIKDALLNPTAYAKVWMEEKEVNMVHEAEELPAESLAELMEDENIEITEQDSRMIQVPVPGPMEQQGPRPMIDIEVFDLKYRETKKEMQLRIQGVPPEEVLVDADLTSVNLDDAAFVCHRSRQSFTSLVNMGYDEKKLRRAAPANDDVTWNEERVNRLFYEDESPSHNNEADDGNDDSMRMLWVHECNAWVDYDGDGVAEYRRIVMIGGEIFVNEETSYQPLVAMSSILVPHKHNGLSVAQLVQDLQLVLTTLQRQLLNNIYDINSRRRFMNENSLLNDGRTLHAAMNPSATLVLVDGPPQEAVMPDPSLSIIGDLLPVIQDQRQATSLRTGIAPENAIDPNVLQQSTYGAFMGAMDKANERRDLYARVMAETGIKQIYLKAHQLIRMHPDMAETVRLRNKWVQVDPRSWRDRTDVKITVGLGFADKQQMLVANMQVLELQQQVAAHGLADVGKVYNALANVVDLSGLGSPDFLFNNPSDEGWQPPEPETPPEAVLMLAQADAVRMSAETAQMKAQADAQATQMKAQAEMQKLQNEAQKIAIEGEVKLRELVIKEQERADRERGNSVGAFKTVAETENVEMDTELKEAQRVKALADANKSTADANRPDPKPSGGETK